MHMINAIPKIAEDKNIFQSLRETLKYFIASCASSNTTRTMITCPNSSPTLKPNKGRTRSDSPPSRLLK